MIITKVSNGWKQRLSLFGLLLVFLLTLGTALPVAAQKDPNALCPPDSSSGCGGELICAASVKIDKPTQAKGSPNVRVPYTWETTGTEVDSITIEIFDHPFNPDDTPLWDTTVLNPPPSGSENRLIFGKIFNGPGIYWVRITVETECGASSMFMRPFFYKVW